MDECTSIIPLFNIQQNVKGSPNHTKKVITLYSHQGGLSSCDISKTLSVLPDTDSGHRHRASLLYVCACGSSNWLDKLYHTGRQDTCKSSYGWPHLTWPTSSSDLSLHILCPAPPVEDACFHCHHNAGLRTHVYL